MRIGLRKTNLIDITGQIIDGPRLIVKDETCASSGSHKQRAARAVVVAAEADGYRRVAVGSCGNYGLAIAAEARTIGIEATVVLPEGFANDGARVQQSGANVEFVNGSYEDAVMASRHLALVKTCADGNVDGPYASNVMVALREIGEELIEVMREPPEAIWVPLGNGTTVAAIANSVADYGWRSRIVAVTSAGNNSVLASWPGKNHMPLPAAALVPTGTCEPLINWNALHGQEAMDALRKAAGHVIGMTDGQLCDASESLAGCGIHVSPAGAAGIAGLTACHRECIRATVHVAVVTGR